MASIVCRLVDADPVRVEYAKAMDEAQHFEAAMQAVAINELEIPDRELSREEIQERAERFSLPRHGAIVELLVHYHGHWQPIRTPRTNSHGVFKIAYQFEGGTGRFPFRIEIPAGQAGFPYTTGYSNTINVTTN